jgi:acetyl esterase/lipase
MGGQAFDIGMFGDIATLRDFISVTKKNATASHAPVPGVKEEKDHQITMRDGEKITVRTYTPEKTGGPLYVMYHGGGWCIGGLENEELLCRLLCGQLGFVAVNVDYRLAPEHTFPTAHNDCWDATKWVSCDWKRYGNTITNAIQVGQNASQLGADPSKGFVVGGTSAGGNIAAAITHLARDEKFSPPVTGAHLMIPAICSIDDLPSKYQKDQHSWEQNEHAAILSRKACDLFYDCYVPSESDRGSELFSPLIFKTGHAGLPPSYLQVCGADPLRDEALIYERVLREEEGLATKVDVYPGLPHGFWSVFPTIESSKKFVEESVKGVQWLLEQKKWEAKSWATQQVVSLASKEHGCHDLRSPTLIKLSLIVMGFLILGMTAG